jgi:hypothetical protein
MAMNNATNMHMLNQTA